MAIHPMNDGPLQRQMMLLKLVHELENRPDFGTTYIWDPDHPVNLWFGRVKAIMGRVGISESISFNSALSTRTRFWLPGIQSAISLAHDAVEAIKLELELHHHDQIGQVYEAGQWFKFQRDLLDIIGRSESDLFVVDPYFDPPTFNMMFSGGPSAAIRILLNKQPDGVREVVRRYVAETGHAAEVRTSKAIHDRVLFVDVAEGWIIGASIKDSGRKPTYIMPVPPQLVPEKLRIYEELWRHAS